MWILVGCFGNLSYVGPFMCQAFCLFLPRIPFHNFCMGSCKNSHTHFHIARSDHVIDLEGVKVVDIEDSQKLRQIKEALQIRQNTPVMNRDQRAYQLSPIYRHLFAGGNQSSSGQRRWCHQRISSYVMWSVKHPTSYTKFYSYCLHTCTLCLLIYISVRSLVRETLLPLCSSCLLRWKDSFSQQNF